MISLQEYKDACNAAFDSAVKGMEAGLDYKEIRSQFLKVAELLGLSAKLDVAHKDVYFQKIGLMIKFARDIEAKKSYDEVYFEIKKKPLPSSIELEPLPIEEEPEEEPEETEKEPEKLEDHGDVGIDYQFEWNDIPAISFDDVAGLDDVKNEVQKKVLIPLKNPELQKGYVNENSHGLLLYGPPGTGKTMIASAIAHEINAKFCTIIPHDILSNGVGASERKINQLFKEAHSFKCAIIFFDELDSLCPASTRSIISKQIRSELLAQINGVSDYGDDSDRILYLVGASNKPWEIDSAFLRPGRFGERIYVGLPDFEARKYIINHTLKKIKEKNIVKISEDIDIDKITNATDGFNGADISELMNKVQDISLQRASETDEKTISQADFDEVLQKMVSSVQSTDIEKLRKWTEEFNARSM